MQTRKNQGLFGIGLTFYNTILGSNDPEGEAIWKHRGKNEKELSLPNDKILDGSKLEASADDKINVTKELKFILGREKKTLWGKEKILVFSWLPAFFSFYHNVCNSFLFLRC